MSETTTLGSSSPSSPETGAGRWTLVLIGRGDLRTVALTPGAEVVIGRDAEATVRLDHARISRRHARLRVGDRCTIEDLGSRNGTNVRGKVVPAGEVRELVPGESFELGPFTAVLMAEITGAASAPANLTIDDPAPAHPPALLTTCAKSPLTVLIRGESGAGKDVLANTLHRLSGRTGDLLRLNCATFHAELLESELFGHEKGAFTGAVAAKPGLLEVAAGGTVFLDEIGELPLPLQARLLRAIEAREVMRVGGTRPVAIDVRFIAATNRDLHAEIQRGTFRLDLYYRLAIITLTVPPLRERPARLVQLAHELLAAAAAAAGRATPRLAPSAVARLQSHAWPGNVRELRNTLERALLLAPGAEIGGEHVVIDAPVAAVDAAPTDAAAGERARIIDALDRCAGNQTRAARLLGISRATLATRLTLFGIPRPRGR